MNGREGQCNWCGDMTLLVKSKPYCYDCQEKMYQECIRCKRPFTEAASFTDDLERCNACQKKYLKEVASAKKRASNLKKTAPLKAPSYDESSEENDSSDDGSSLGHPKRVHSVSDTEEAGPSKTPKKTRASKGGTTTPEIVPSKAKPATKQAGRKQAPKKAAKLVQAKVDNMICDQEKSVRQQMFQATQDAVLTNRKIGYIPIFM